MPNGHGGYRPNAGRKTAEAAAYRAGVEDAIAAIALAHGRLVELLRDPMRQPTVGELKRLAGTSAA